MEDLSPSVATNIILSFIALQNGPVSRFDEAGPLVSAALEADATAPVHLHLIGEKTGEFTKGIIELKMQEGPCCSSLFITSIRYVSRFMDLLNSLKPVWSLRLVVPGPMYFMIPVQSLSPE